ncbi:MAG: hypothetical protein EA402_08045 [Planctomycetota bacterium]|nr:MAG: hypothetical protein EA402_08045 [Planctomycetota bacterium]
MAKTKRPVAGGPKTPEWVVTFSDLMSLLLTFFVLLLTFSTPRIEKLFELRGSIQAAFGIVFARPAEMDDRETWVPPNPTRQGRDMFNPHAPALMPRFRPLEDNEPNRDLQQLRDQSGQTIDWDRIASGYRLTLRDAIRFEPGQRDMTGESFPRLPRVADAVEFIPYRLVVVGLVGADELALLQQRNEDAMSLALDRAVSTAARLVERHGVDPGIIAISGRIPAQGVDSAGGGVEFMLARSQRFAGGGM